MKRGLLLKAAALAVDVGVPAAATLSRFPLWVERGAEATCSGLCLLLLVVAALPLLRRLKELLASPSVWALWGVLFLLFAALRTVIDELVFVAFFGFVANVFGAVLYKAGEALEKRARNLVPEAEESVE